MATLGIVLVSFTAGFLWCELYYMYRLKKFSKRNEK